MLMKNAVVLFIYCSYLSFTHFASSDGILSLLDAKAVIARTRAGLEWI
jgi:hypothetical protein